MGHQEEPRGALAQGGQGEGMVQIQRELNRTKRKTVGTFLGHHMEMSGSQKTKGKASNRKAWVGDAEIEWAEPISQEQQQWVSQHLEEKLKEYGGEFTQTAAVQVTLADRMLPRYVN
jgi:hypothetical protein